MGSERLDTLRYFLAAESKRASRKELQRALEEPYGTYVPIETRAYLDARYRSDGHRPRRPTAPKVTRMQEGEVTGGDH